MPDTKNIKAIKLLMLAIPVMFYNIANAQVNTSAREASVLTDEFTNNPFRDPDIIYLEADSLINNENDGVLIASGQVIGKYQERTLRAEKVVYTLATGVVIASGNVVLIDPNGSTQYASKLELSNELETGTATDFTARQVGNGLTSAAFATRTENGEIELYNAYYTACKLCKEKGKTKKPSWRIKARKVRQDKKTRTFRYNSALLEIGGLPLFWTPYLAHPDPSAERSSGFLTPFVGVTSSKGFNIRAPYYWAINEYTEATLTPNLYQNVNPMMKYQFIRKFNTGALSVDGSLTYSSFFDRDGNEFNPDDFQNPSQVPTGKKLRSHTFIKGLFSPSKTWSYGFGLELSSDDDYLNRYNLEEASERFGVYNPVGRRNTSQAFIVGQQEDFRFSASTVGYQDLRSNFRENVGTGLITVSEPDDRELPILAPKIKVEKYWTDPIFKGRIKGYGDLTALTRDIGNNYLRGTAGIDYSKNTVTAVGLELKTFLNSRYDFYKIKPEDKTNANYDSIEFQRNLGQVGFDARYPFIKRGKNINLIVEPRVQLTNSFGSSKLSKFQAYQDSSMITSINPTEINYLSTQQDGQDIDLTASLLWQSNKSTGFDFWESGLRADIGASLIADAGNSSAQLFIGRSYAENSENDFSEGSGLFNKKSDIVSNLELDINKNLSIVTRVRYDDNENKLRRLDSSLNYRSKYINTNLRYYRLNSSINSNFNNGAPNQEVNGDINIKIRKNWSLGYSAARDIDLKIMRNQRFSVKFNDDCTLVEVFYAKNNFNSASFTNVTRNTSGLGIRISLLTLGSMN
ncbi:LPS assembly protein LptD [Hellea sp.]|nr:LPS assembly protein LptD [Hellea sp.]MDB4845282.1 LPS assembly protein LptD [Hellea sp.]